jgi:hypothetical protein
MLRNVIWTRFFTKPVCWQNSVVIFEKSYLPHMTSCLAEIWKFYRPLSQESKNIELHQLDFCSSRYLILNGQRSTLVECEIWLWRMWFPWSLSFYFSCIKFPERYGCLLFSATGITSFWPLELTLCTKHRLNAKSANYLQFTPFYIFHPKVSSKHKIRNIKAFYIYNIG